MKKMRIVLLVFMLLFSVPILKAQNTSKNQSSKTNPYKEKTKQTNQFLMLNTEFMAFNFDEFKDVFHQKNIDLLSKNKLFWGIEYGVKLKKTYAGLTLNIGSQKGEVNDSIDSKSNFSRIGLSFGHYALNTKHIQCIPRIGFFLNNIDIKNFPSKDDIPLTDYVNSPNIDINFRQYSMQLGLDINYKTEKLSLKPGHPFIVGIKIGYNTNLGDSRITSNYNTLTSKKTAVIDPFSLGFHFTMLI